MGYVGNQQAEGFVQRPTKQDLTGATGTSLTLSHAVSKEEDIDLYINNVKQEPTTAYTVADTAVTLTGSVVATDDIYVVYNSLALQTVVPPDGSVTSAKLVYPLTTFSSTGIDDNATSTAMTLDNSGNVALNNAKYLQFKDAGGTARDVLAIDAYNGLNINSAGGGSAAPIVFKENGSEIARFDSSGNLLVGATVFDLIGNNTDGVSAAGYGEAQISRDGGTALKLHRKTNTGGILEFFYNGATIVGSVSTNGSSVSYNTSSDYRLKENVTDITGATDRLKQLNPVRFNFIADADTTVDGFLAHEVQDVVPEAITGTKDAVDADGNPEYQGIDQSKLVPLLVKTIQELEARIAALEAE